MRFIIFVLLIFPALQTQAVTDYSQFSRYEWNYDGNNTALVRSKTHGRTFFMVVYSPLNGCEPSMGLMTFLSGVDSSTPGGYVNNVQVRVDRQKVYTSAGLLSYNDYGQEFVFLPIDETYERTLKYGSTVRTKKPLQAGGYMYDVFTLQGSSVMMGRARKDCLRESAADSYFQDDTTTPELNWSDDDTFF